jgi:enoyl-CoA hydratase
MNINREWNTLKFEIKDGFGLLTINRPTKLNALNTELLSELKELLVEVKKDSQFAIKGIVMTGEGEKAFIAGADIAEMIAGKSLRLDQYYADYLNYLAKWFAVERH